MNIEARLKELEVIVNKLEDLLSEKDMTIRHLKNENLKLKAEIEIMGNIVYCNHKTSYSERKDGVSNNADLSEYARNLARQYAGRIRSDG